MNTATTSQNTSEYFNLHLTGLGYLNNIREVRLKKGSSFLACNIAALVGTVNEPEYRYIDVRVSGEAAQHLVRRCEDAVQTKKKVLIGFRIGDLWADLFTYEKGSKAGQPGVSLKGRLLHISWIKIDGELVYKAESKSEGNDSDNALTDQSGEEADGTSGTQTGESEPEPEAAPFSTGSADKAPKKADQF